MEVFLFIVIPCWCISGLIGYFIAKSRQHSTKEGMVLGCLLGPIGWIIAALQSAPTVSADGRQMRKCPACAEMVLAEATVCRYCQHELPPLQSQPAISVQQSALPKQKMGIGAWIALGFLILIVIFAVLVIILPPGSMNPKQSDVSEIAERAIANPQGAEAKKIRQDLEEWKNKQNPVALSAAILKACIGSKEDIIKLSFGSPQRVTKTIIGHRLWEYDLNQLDYESSIRKAGPMLGKSGLVFELDNTGRVISYNWK